jgi:hypothetical protein
MFCKNCGKQVKDGAAFCNNCGATLVKTAEKPVQSEAKNKVEEKPTVSSAQPKQSTNPPKKGFVYGLISVLFGAWIPFLGLPLPICGLIFSNKELKKSPNNLSRAGKIMSIVGIVIGILMLLLVAVGIATDDEPDEIAPQSAQIENIEMPETQETVENIEVPAQETTKEYESADNSDNSWLIGTWEVNLPEFGLYKLVITDSQNCYTVDSYGRKGGTYEIDGDLMVVYNDSYGTDYPLDRANKRISAGYGYYFKKVK